MRLEEAPQIENSLSSRLAVWLATGLGVGLVAPAPGTIAGLWGLLLVPGIVSLPTFVDQMAITAVMLLLAAPICSLAARALGASGDPGAVVLDEIVALPVVFLGVHALTWPIVVVGYLLFRLFDIWKPGLVRELEKLPGGWGIVADDVGAAALAWAALRGLLWIDGARGLGWLAGAG